MGWGQLYEQRFKILIMSSLWINYEFDSDNEDYDEYFTGIFGGILDPELQDNKEWDISSSSSFDNCFSSLSITPISSGYNCPDCGAPDCDGPDCDGPDCDAPDCDAPDCNGSDCNGSDCASSLDAFEFVLDAHNRVILAEGESYTDDEVDLDEMFGSEEVMPMDITPQKKVKRELVFA